jgi:hypothetical protein
MRKSAVCAGLFLGVVLSACGTATDSEEGESSSQSFQDLTTGRVYSFNGTHYAWWGGTCFNGSNHPWEVVSSGTVVTVVAQAWCSNGWVAHIEGRGINGWTFASYLH